MGWIKAFVDPVLNLVSESSPQSDCRSNRLHYLRTEKGIVVFDTHSNDSTLIDPHEIRHALRKEEIAIWLNICGIIVTLYVALGIIQCFTPAGIVNSFNRWMQRRQLRRQLEDVEDVEDAEEAMERSSTRPPRPHRPQTASVDPSHRPVIRFHRSPDDEASELVPIDFGRTEAPQTPPEYPLYQRKLVYQEMVKSIKRYQNQ